MSRMGEKILVVSHLFPNGERSATGRFVEDQVCSIQEMGYETTVLTVRFRRIALHKPFDCLNAAVEGLFRGAARKCTSVRSIEYFEIQCPAPGLGGVVQAWIYSLCLKQFVRKMREPNRVKLIHAHTSLLDGYAVKCLAKRLKVPFLITEHTGPFRSLLVRFGAWRLLKNVFHESSAVVAVSSALKSEMICCFPEIENKLSVIPNTYSAEPFKFDENIEPEMVIGWLGYMAPIKRIDRLLIAFAEMKKSRSDLKLKIISQQTLSEIHRKLAQDLGVVDSIVYAEASSRFEVAVALQSVALLMVTSDTETFSVACLEALAVGTPVVSTNCGGPSDIIRSPEDGVVIDSKEPAELAAAALRIVNFGLGSKTLRKARSVRASEAFGSARIGRSYSELYAKLLAADNP